MNFTMSIRNLYYTHLNYVRTKTICLHNILEQFEEHFFVVKTKYKILYNYKTEIMVKPLWWQKLKTYDSHEYVRQNIKTGNN